MACRAKRAEATRATRGQQTIVYFLGAEHGGGSLERYGLSALEFAIATGARILTVACWGAVEDGLAAYVWLLGEGCDTRATAFTDPVGGTLAAAVLEAGSARGLPLPSAGVWLSVLLTSQRENRGRRPWPATST